MGLIDILTRVAVVDSALVAIGLVLVVGPSRIRSGLRRVQLNVRAVIPAAAVLALVLAMNRVVRQAGMDLSWIIGLNITGDIYDIEGDFVPVLQSFATPPVTAYFEVIYIYG